jgi:hypothetical protein
MASNDLTPELDLELSTMQMIATALARLDPGARARTLTWLRSRFDCETVSAQPIEPPAWAPMTDPVLQAVSHPTRVAAYDDALSVDSLAELFDGVDPISPPARFDDAARPAAQAAPNAVTGLLSQLATGFQELARDWGPPVSSAAEALPPGSPLSSAS